MSFAEANETTSKPDPDSSAYEEHLPALAELAGVIWRQHYPGLISHEQIDYMLGKIYALDTLRGDLCSRGIHFYQLVVDGRMAGFASIGHWKCPAFGRCTALPAAGIARMRPGQPAVAALRDRGAAARGAAFTTRGQQAQPAPHRGVSTQRNSPSSNRL